MKWITFFTTLAELNQVAHMSSKFFGDLFDASVEKGGYKTGYMQYGLHVHVLAIAITDHHIQRYCVPMDGHRLELDLKFYKDIRVCSDPNGTMSRTFMRLKFMHHFEVPVIVVFTKYDQFYRNVKMDVLDYPEKYPDSNASEVVEQQFQEHYLRPLGDDIRYVRLESGFRLRSVRCQGYVLTFFDRNAEEW